jgi:hypothetical protein
MVPRRALAVGGFDLCRDLFCTGSFSTIELVLLGFRPSRPWIKSFIGADYRFRAGAPSHQSFGANHKRIRFIHVRFIHVKRFFKFVGGHVIYRP